MNNTHGILEQTMKWIALYLPSVYAGLCALGISALIDIRAGLCALGISALIDIRAGKPKLYTATGALICGIFALAVSALLEYFGLPANSGAFVGALVGFVGADRLRDMALAIVARRAGVNSTEEKQ